jgi:putative transposase
VIQSAQRRFPGLPLERMCQLLAVNRGSYYRHQEAPPPASAEVALRAAIEAVVLEFPAYGYRRVTKALQRDDWLVNHKHVLRIMREESLLCRLRRRWVKTTDSEHGLTVYPNLLKDAGWQKLTRIDEAWVADITYIRLPQGFCYLAAILDGFSRKVVGWELAEEIDGALVLAALRQALAARKPAAGWIHHSDRGVQYACGDYVQLLLAAGAQVSMSGKGRPRDNAQAESFMRTLKHEEVYLQDYQSFQEAKQAIGRFIDAVYNEKRLHSSLGYRPPSEFEQLLAAGFFS